MTIVREHGLKQFGPDAMMSTVRVGEGEWNSLVNGRREACRRMEKFDSFMRVNWRPELRDECHFHSPAAQPGQVVTRFEQPPPSRDLAEQFRDALTFINWRDFDFMCASVQSRNVFVARIAPIYGRPQSFSEDDRALLSTIADLASFALS